MSQGLMIILAVLVSVAPILLGLAAARRTNWLHGVIATFFFTYVVVFCLATFAAAPAAGSFGAICKEVCEGYFLFHNGFIIENLSKVAFIAKFATQPWVYLVVYGVIYLVSLIIASAIAASKARKIRDLKREAKRY